MPTQDLLTSLPCRRLFQQRLDSELSVPHHRRQTIAVLDIDIHRLHDVYERHGRQTCDFVLQILADRLKLSTRRQDLACRLSSHQFGYLVKGLPDRHRLRRFVGNLCETLSAPLRVRQRYFWMPPTIGIAMRPPAGVTAEELLRRADAAAQAAQHGGARYTFFAG